MIPRTAPDAISQTSENKNFPVEYQIAGLFHDLLEDTTVSEKEIFSFSFLVDKSILFFIHICH